MRLLNWRVLWMLSILRLLWSICMRKVELGWRLGISTNDTGVGLGLAVARGFVEAMGGTIVVDDTPGGGVTIDIGLEVAAS